MSAPDPSSGDDRPAEQATSGSTLLGETTSSHTILIDTDGGAYITGNVDTGGGDFVGRDKIINVYPPQKTILSAAQIASYEAAYLTQVRRACRYIHTEGIGEPTTELTGVFIMFEAMAKPESRKATPLLEAGDVVPLPERFAQIGYPDPMRPPQKEPQKEPPPPPPPIPLSQAMHDHTHIVVLGEPGTGKSTTLQYVALCLATPGWAAKLTLPEGCVPVLLSLRSCDGVRMLPEFLANEIAQLGMFDAADSVEARRIAVTLLGTWLQEKRLVLLLDALDETAEGQRAAVLEQVVRFAASHEGRNCRIVVTSRIAGYNVARRPGADFAEYIIHPFASPADALPYVRGWLQALAPGTPPDQAELQAKTLIDHMAQQQGLKRILGTPLLLRLAVAVYVETGRLVANRAEIYRRYVDEVLWQRTQAHHGQQFAHEDVRQALALVAWTLHTNANASSAQLAGGIEEISGKRISGEQMLAFLQHNLGLLGAYTYDHGPKLAFRHLTFQEYLVGRRLAEQWMKDKDVTWRLLWSRLHHPAWREPLLLMAGMLPPGAANDLIQRIVRAKSRYERELHRDLLLAMTVAGDCGCADIKMIDLLTSQALTIARHSFDSYRLVDDYHRSGAIGVVGMLEIYGCDYSEQKLWRIICALRWPSGIAADEQMLIRLLAQLGVSAVSSLFEVLSAADSHSDMRRAAAVALGEIGDATAVPALVKALSDPDYGVRSDAATALGEIGDAVAVSSLFEVCSLDSGPGVNWAAAKALGKVSDATAVPSLVKALSNRSSSVRSIAAFVLGKIGDATAVPALVKALSDSDSGVRKEAATALGEIGDAAAMPALVKALSDLNAYSDSSVSEEAAKALGKIGDAVDVSALLESLSDSNTDSEVRFFAAIALGQIGNAVAVPALLKALSNSGLGANIRFAATIALSMIGDTAGMPAVSAEFSNLHSHPNPGMRMAVAEALGKSGDAAAVPILVKAISDSDWHVRIAAAEALGMIGDAAAVPALSEALAYSDPYSVVRCTAAESLGKIGNAAAVPALTKALASGGDIGSAAAKALGVIGDATALSALLKVLTSSAREDAVGWAATKALSEHAAMHNEWDQTTIALVARNLNIYVYHSESSIRAEAANALEQVATAITIRETSSLEDTQQLEW